MIDFFAINRLLHYKLRLCSVEFATIFETKAKKKKKKKKK